MTKVLVMSCPYGMNIDSPILILGYLNSVLKKEGFQTYVVDLNFELHATNKEVYNETSIDSGLITWETKDDFLRISNRLKAFNNGWIKKIRKDNYSAYLFSVHRANLLYTVEMVKLIREFDKSSPIIVGGPSTNHEGEICHFPKGLVDIFVKTNQMNEIPNIIKNSKSISNGKKDVFIEVKQVRRDLNKRPFPDFDDFSIWNHKVNSLPFIGSEGCVRNCSFCNEILYENKFFYRDGEAVALEVIRNYHKYGVTHYEQNDLECNGNLKHLEKFCDKIIESGIKITWVSYAILRKDMSDDLIRKMKQSGCLYLKIGLESGSNKVLQLMRKGITKEIAAHNLRQFKNAGIDCGVNLIVGFPGETEEDFQETLGLLYGVKNYIARVNNIFECYITPGSDMERNPERYGITWDESPDFWYTWTDKTGSTKEVRRDRFLRLLEFLREHKFKFPEPDFINNKNMYLDNDETVKSEGKSA